MKNIFVIPTDKYSPLVHSTSKYGGLFLSRYYSPMKVMGDSYQNIYITSDEEIKEGDYCLSKLNEIVKFNSGYDYRYYAKIILTTDQDLIKDGVQAIDDEFLEWFVKNPSCEEVKIKEEDYSQKCRECGETVKRGYSCNKGCFMKTGNFIPTDENIKYKIIIPQKEPKDVILGYKTSLDAQSLDSHYVDFSNPNADKISSSSTTSIKQETLEESFDRIYNSIDFTEFDFASFKLGAKWQQEQILQFLYSEITERRPYSASKMCEVVIGFIEQLNNK